MYLLSITKYVIIDIEYLSNNKYFVNFSVLRYNIYYIYKFISDMLKKLRS